MRRAPREERLPAAVARHTSQLNTAARRRMEVKMAGLSSRFCFVYA